MRDFEDIYEKYDLRVRPWNFLDVKETSYIIYNGYRLNYLKDEDVYKSI